MPIARHTASESHREKPTAMINYDAKLHEQSRSSMDLIFIIGKHFMLGQGQFLANLCSFISSFWLILFAFDSCIAMQVLPIGNNYSCEAYFPVDEIPKKQLDEARGMYFEAYCHPPLHLGVPFEKLEKLSTHPYPEKQQTYYQYVLPSNKACLRSEF